MSYVLTMDEPKASKVTAEEAYAYAEYLVNSGMDPEKIKRRLKTYSLMVNAIGDRSVAKILNTLANGKGKRDLKRQPDSGQFRHSHDAWLCVCGHPLAFHTAAKARTPDGIEQPCIIGDDTLTSCPCVLFRKARPAQAADKQLIADVTAGKYSNRPAPDFTSTKTARLARVIRELGALT